MKRHRLRRLAALLLPLVLLVSCSAPRSAAPESASVPSETSQPPAPAPLAPGLYELASFDGAESEYVLSFARRGDEAVIYSRRYAEESSEGFLQFLDLPTGKLAAPVRLQGEQNDDLTQIDYTQNGSLLLYSPYAAEARLYRRDGSLLDVLPCPVGSESWERNWHPMAERSFSYYDGCAVCHSYQANGLTLSAFAFYDEEDALYFTDVYHDTFCCAEGHTLLEADYAEGGGALTFTRTDYDAGQRTDRMTLPAESSENNYLNYMNSLLCGDRALLLLEDYQSDDSFREHVYLWVFSGEQTEEVSVRRLTQEDLAAENARIIAGIRDDYEIEVLADVVPGSEISEEERRFRDDYGAEIGCTDFEIYELLLQLEDFLKSLPPGFTHEMRTDYPGWEPSHTEFKIYIVWQIPGFPAAYAFHGAPDTFYICLAAQEFAYSHLPHEFEHLIDARLEAYLSDRGQNLWELWEALNPPGLEYEENADADPDHYVSAYARTNQMEDRAETFMSAYMAEEPFAECWWYAECPDVAKKVDTLLQLIREAFPSVQNAETVIWEH